MDIQVKISNEQGFERRFDFGFAKSNEKEGLEAISELIGEQNIIGRSFESQEELVRFIGMAEDRLSRLQYVLNCIRYEANNWGVPDDATFFITFG